MLHSMGLQRVGRDWVTEQQQPWAVSQQEVHTRNLALPLKINWKNSARAHNTILWCPRLLQDRVHFGWERHVTPGRTLSQTKHGQTRRLARDNLETNLIYYKSWGCKTCGRTSLLHSLTLLLSACGPPDPIKVFAFSARVFPQTIHFQVLDKSPLSVPGRGPIPATVQPSMCGAWLVRENSMYILGFLMAPGVKNLPVTQETQVQSLGQEYPLEKKMITHFSTFAWEILWTEEPGELQSMGSQKNQTWLID